MPSAAPHPRPARSVGQQIGAMNSTARPIAQLVPLTGPMTPAEADSATTNWKLTAHLHQTLRPAAPVHPTHILMAAVTLPFRFGWSEALTLRRA